MGVMAVANHQPMYRLTPKICQVNQLHGASQIWWIGPRCTVIPSFSVEEITVMTSTRTPTLEVRQKWSAWKGCHKWWQKTDAEIQQPVICTSYWWTINSLRSHKRSHFTLKTLVDVCDLCLVWITSLPFELMSESIPLQDSDFSPSMQPGHQHVHNGNLSWRMVMNIQHPKHHDTNCLSHNSSPIHTDYLHVIIWPCYSIQQARAHTHHTHKCI